MTGMIGDLFAGRPPSYDILLGVDSVIQVVQIHGVIKLRLDLVIVFFVRYAEAVCNFYDSLLRSS